MIEIKHRFTNDVLYACDADNLKNALVEAVKNGADLSYADFHCADLSYADFHCANFRGANFRGANFRGANFRGANFRGANLSYADFHGANLYGADFSCADFHGANLYGADFSCADFHGANLYGEKFNKIPLFLYNLQYWCVITEKHMKLGCKVYTHEEWSNFTDDEISEMYSKALEFWNVWKEPLLTMCKAHRGE